MTRRARIISFVIIYAFVLIFTCIGCVLANLNEWLFALLSFFLAAFIATATVEDK